MALATFFKSLFGGAGSTAAPPAEPIEYKGFKIVAEPINEDGQFRTAGIISREHEGVVHDTQFIRADNNSSHEAAIEHTIRKARQIIDEQGDSLLHRDRA